MGRDATLPAHGLSQQCVWYTIVPFDLTSWSKRSLEGLYSGRGNDPNATAIWGCHTRWSIWLYWFLVSETCAFLSRVLISFIPPASFQCKQQNDWQMTFTCYTQDLIRRLWVCQNRSCEITNDTMSRAGMWPRQIKPNRTFPKHVALYSPICDCKIPKHVLSSVFMVL